ncbi:WD40 repeat domain-containing serine/threonine protein kinase [Nocardiopsis sp. MG754419]|uniref:WD40 repeat domain-containing serine/threonine protein kinase n=1 Tax=Nocardiopsis sp. MG754419 TaxID=2259865 RepID=UPI001BA7A895|nr:serine/threonine-protein kinase [Nocardiopsis sp. MG754419]MBR8745347.1 serine/threonine protein kinase [Nocardiopsis sp. MG754419]
MYTLTQDDPRTIGPYRLLASLGSGGMGHVYLGVDGSGHRAAVKVVRAELAYDPDFRARFARELESAGGVRGPYLPRVYASGPTDEIPWMATEYVPGPSLRGLVERAGPLPEPAALVLARAVALALTRVHATGTAHRDLTPGNVMVAPDGPRVIDFGIARAVDGVEETDDERRMIGTPGYIAPEVLRGEAGGAPADVFAFGGVLVFALTGRGPFGDGHPSTVLYRTEHADPDLTGVPPFLRRLVSACLDRDPDRRPSTELVLETLGGPPSPVAEAGEWLPGPAADVVAEVGRAHRALLRKADHGREIPGHRARTLLTVGAAATALALVAGFGVWSASLLPSGEDVAAADGEDAPPTATSCDPRDLADPFVEAASPEPTVPGAGEDDFVGQPVFSPDGAVLAVGGSDGIALWDWREETELGRIDLHLLGSGHVVPAFSPDGCRIAYPDEDGVHVYTLATGEYEVLFEGGHVWSMAFSPDGDSLAVSVAGEDSLHVLDLDGGEREDLRVGETDSGGSAGFHQIVYSPGGDRMAATGTWGLWMWDTDTWEVVGSVEDAFLPLDGAGGLAVPDDTGGVVYMDRDGPLYADLSTGRSLRYDTEDDEPGEPRATMREFTHHPVTDVLHGIRLVQRDDGTGTLLLDSWDLDDGAPREHDDAGSADAPLAMTPHPDEEVLAAISLERGGVMLLDATTLRELDHIG